jgi:flavin-dependent dehydrogenase
MELCTLPKVYVHDIIIIGGGLAGLTAAIDLSCQGYDVVLFETNSYPHHKVCGEYISNEVRPYLRRLGIDLSIQGAVEITDFEISTVNGYMASTKLPLGGMGMSRYTLDNVLYKKAIEQGVTCKFSKVAEVAFMKGQFHVKAGNETYFAKVVIGAYGKRSVLDKSLGRDFSFNKHGWLAVKGHFNHPSFPQNLVALHNFEGGYGGLSRTESGAVNFCYLANYQTFKRHNDIGKFNQNVVAENKFLKQFLYESQPIFDSPLTIAQISFQKKAPVVDHILMSGDTAGLIHPLCGNGMAMAIHSAKIASKVIGDYLSNASYGRSQMEQDYAKVWNRTFKQRLWYGRKLQHLLLRKRYFEVGVRMVGNSKSLLQFLIHKTHGRTIE